MEALRWKPGNFGTVLRPLDLYLLEGELEIHPIFAQKCDAFRLEFNLATGITIGYKGNDRRNELEFTMKDEFATLPRITELIIITPASPWCTIVRNDRGVSLANVCLALWKEYADTPLTEAEFKQLSPREQDRVQRQALRREGGAYASTFAGLWGSTATVTFERCRRIDCLHGNTFFDGLEHDDAFAKKQLGFAAPNVFKLKICD